MTVLPADHRADLQKLEKIDGEPASLETEEEFESLFPNCAKGAIRPFGNLYGLPTCMDKRLTQEDYIVFGITTPNGKNRTPSSKIPRGSLQWN